MSEPYRLVRYRGRWAVAYTEDGQRRRHSLGTDDRALAETRFGSFVTIRSRPDAGTVSSLWNAYTKDNVGKAVIATMLHTWKALRPIFANVRPDDVSPSLCRQHTAARREAGISDGTIWTELGHLRMVLIWGEKQKALEKAPHVERPEKPSPRERHLTKEDARALIAAATMPHVKAFVILALATAARKSALLELTWDRVDLETGMINLKNPAIGRRHKGRALVPMNRMARAILVEGKEAATSDYVIEWGGEKVASVRRSLSAAARKAGLADVTPHVLRHTAAVWMAEAGRPMAEVAQYLGHRSSKITETVYARFSPRHLRDAAQALEFDDLRDAEILNAKNR